MLRYAFLALALLATPLRPGVAHADEPLLASTTATLSILSGTVQRVPVGTPLAEAATDGASLQAGDRILTDANARALVTFLDGSTLTVEPASDILVQQADVGAPGDGSTITIRVNLGSVWARVVRLVGPGSNFSLSSNTATAVVHDGLPGAAQKADGTFMCWTFAGDLTLMAPGQPNLVLQSHQTTAVMPGTPAGIRPVNLNASTLRITTSGAVLPLLQMPDNARVAGFVAPGLEVNQVFASFTETSDDTYTIEVPGGETGPYNLVLEGQRDDAFSVDIEGLASGKQAYAETLSGTIATGERLISTINQQLEPGPSASDPKKALVHAAAVAPLQPLVDAPPGKIILSQAEIDSLGTE